MNDYWRLNLLFLLILLINHMFVFQFLLIKHSLSERSHVIKLSWSNVIRTKGKNPTEFSKLNSFLHYRKLFLHLCVFFGVWSKKMWLIKQFKMIWNALIKNPKRAIMKFSWWWEKKIKLDLWRNFQQRKANFIFQIYFEVIIKIAVDFTKKVQIWSENSKASHVLR